MFLLYFVILVCFVVQYLIAGMDTVTAMGVVKTAAPLADTPCTRRSSWSVTHPTTWGGRARAASRSAYPETPIALWSTIWQ